MVSILNAKSNLPYYSFTPRRHAPVKKRRFNPKKLFIKTIAVCAAIVFLQFLYPSGQALPNARLGDTNLGSLSLSQAADKISATYGSWSRAVKAGDKSYEQNADSIGLKINPERTASESLDYLWWQRLMPGSFIWRLFSPAVIAVVDTNTDKLNSFASKVQSENYRAYTNAAITTEGEQFSVVPEKDGQDFEVNTIKADITRQFFSGSGDLKLNPKVLEPVIKKGNAEPAQKDAQKIISAPPKYTIGDKQGDITAPVLASWLVFSPNEKDRRLDIKLDPALIKEYLSSLYPYLYKSAVDAAGIPGDDSNAADTASAITSFNAVIGHKGQAQNVVINQVKVTAEMRANRGYTRSQLGLQALLQDIVREKGDYAIAFQQIDGHNWSAAVNGAKKYTPASTYKLFVAYAVLRNIETGVWTWGGSIAGTSVDDCFGAMILYSDNTCAEAFGNTIGWKKIESQMRELGLKDTVLNSGNFVSTADDEILFMTKLGRGEILAESSRNKLIDVMKRQVYRKGIPAGSGVPVADKVGFLYGLLHDAALVYSPKGTYALVILTNNSSWSDIADAAARIQKLLN